MKRFLWCWLCSALLLTSALVRAGNEVGGGGVAEKNIVFAYVNLEKLLPLCIASSLCRLTNEEKGLLQRIVAVLPHEKPVDQAIVFKSEKKEPGFFWVEGELRIAKTELAVGSPIYFNVDLLYLADRRQQLRPLSLSAASAHLVHEIGHHLGERDHLKLDALGAKVQTLLSANVETIDGGRKLREIRVTAIDLGSGHPFTQILVSDASNIHDLTELVKAHAICPPNGPWSPARIVEWAIGFNFWNLHWTNYQYYGPGRSRIPIEPTPGENVQLLTGELELVCAGTEIPRSVTVPVSVQLVWKLVEGNVTLLPEKTEVVAGY